MIQKFVLSFLFCSSILFCYEEEYGFIYRLHIDIWLSLIVFWYTLHLLLIDELPSCKCQDKLIGQLVLWRYSFSLNYPKLEVGEGNNFILTRIHHYLVKKELITEKI